MQPFYSSGQHHLFLPSFLLPRTAADCSSLDACCVTPPAPRTVFLLGRATEGGAGKEKSRERKRRRPSILVAPTHLCPTREHLQFPKAPGIRIWCIPLALHSTPALAKQRQPSGRKVAGRGTQSASLSPSSVTVPFSPRARPPRIPGAPASRKQWSNAPLPPPPPPAAAVSERILRPHRFNSSDRHTLNGRLISKQIKSWQIKSRQGKAGQATRRRSKCL